ncbi:MAG: 3-isopropylmalate dehydratase small subunit [Spirochaetales bacterium]|uniref:3-isopropylmalate dehydratase n=1 Tax=Candidatus Thalassospirochaeta sargassi TaxID=3119039 RepID=A0AAJ1IDY9_9SPIO|nr:3-isopropylmalate dehydratase small subunit [Spirochaetales bacterium]
MKNFSGKALFLDRSDINTDEIIPAKYLTEITKKAMGPHLLEDLKMDDFDPATDLEGISVIITKENFGCGSSREHAPWALEVNDINLVIAPSFARIFRQNMFNCGMMAVEIAEEKVNDMFSKFAGKETTVETDFDAKKFTISAGSESIELDFSISGFDESLVKAGGWVEYADSNY